MLQNATFLLLASTVEVIIPVVVGVVGIALGCLFGVIAVNKSNKSTIGSAEKYASDIKSKAEEESKSIKKQAILEAKEQELQLRNEFEKEKREKTAELQKMEQRLNQKDEILNKKDATLLKRTEEVEQTARNLEKKNQEVDELMRKLELQHETFVHELEKVAQMTQEEAKSMIIEEVKDEARKEAAGYVRNQEQQAKD
ncbi:MAG: DUF3552 domain-containing protein, partial [Clostridia bacterium]|nr:DUF3552 domain-containing protein [Clostridia bacterium]